MSKKILLLDDKYGKINSHWPYSTEKLIIEDRQYYDDPNFIEDVTKKLSQKKYDVFAFSGRKAPDAAQKLDFLFLKEEQILECNRSLPKVFKVHNTNLSDKNVKSKWDFNLVRELGNDWVHAALKYPFDLLLVQTYGDNEIFNQVLKRECAFWVPYCYNDRLYFPRDKTKKELDIGAFFKLERHAHRIDFLEKVKGIADKKGYSFEFSDKYWGESYAENICRAKIMVHLSYCGDIPWRLYECAASKTCLLTDPLAFHVEKLFKRNLHYIEYNRDFSNLELQIEKLLNDENLRNNIINNAYSQVQNYTWEQISTSLIYPLIKRLVS